MRINLYVSLGGIHGTDRDSGVPGERSYEDIERGKTGCGALTVVLLLMEIDNPILFLSDLRKKLEEAYEMAGVPV